MEATIHVQGMSCSHCVQSIEKAVGGVKGVIQVQVHLEKNTVDVEFDMNQISLQQIIEAIEEQGYDAEKESSLHS